MLTQQAYRLKTTSTTAAPCWHRRSSFRSRSFCQSSCHPAVRFSWRAFWLPGRGEGDRLISSLRGRGAAGRVSTDRPFWTVGDGRFDPAGPSAASRRPAGQPATIARDRHAGVGGRTPAGPASQQGGPIRDGLASLDPPSSDRRATVPTVPGASPAPDRRAPSTDRVRSAIPSSGQHSSLPSTPSPPKASSLLFHTTDRPVLGRWDHVPSREAGRRAGR